MKYTSNALNILTALSYKGIGKAWIVKKLTGNESVETIVAFLNETIKEKTDIDIFESKRAGFEKKILHKFESYCDGFIALGDKKFPQHRGNVKDSERPIFLFYKVKQDHKKKNHCFFQRNFCKETRFYLIFPVLHTARPDVPMNIRCLFQYPADNTFRQGHIYSAGHRYRREHGKREDLPFQ